MNPGDQVETVLGVGRISEIRNTPSGLVALVVLEEGGFGRGYSDVFSLEEIEPLQPTTQPTTQGESP